MLQIAQIELKLALEVARLAPLQQAPNGIHYASYGETQLSSTDLERMVLAVPRAVAAALHRKAYYFVPLTLGDASEIDPRQEDPDSNEVLIAPDFSAKWSEQAICHRNVSCNGVECVFISTRLMQDRFALAFEFYINTGHHFVDAVGVPESFSSLVWSQAMANVRGETSQDAWDQRARAIGSPSEPPPINMRRSPRRGNAGSSSLPATNAARSNIVPDHALDEKARTEYLEAAFADAIAIYMLSLTVDFDYTELREREYPLLAPQALAERLHHVARLFPPNDGPEFTIRYRRRNR
jgi:hypothetical protein